MSFKLPSISFAGVTYTVGADGEGDCWCLPCEPSLCWDVKVGWVPVRAIDPTTGRCYVQGPGAEPATPTEVPTNG